MIDQKLKWNSTVASLILVSCFLFIQSLAASGNDRYWVFFADKGKVESLSLFEKEEVVRSQLSDKAIERRLIRAPKNAFNKISIDQDLPVHKDYIEIIKQMGFTVHQKSRWFNAVSGFASNEVLAQISRLPFVRSVETVKRFVQKEKVQNIPNVEPLTPGQLYESFDFDYGPSRAQANFHNIPQLHNQGLSGDGIRIGIFDTGFNLDHPALEHLKPAIISERDFINNDNITKNQAGDLFNQHNHGTATLSVLAGFEEGKLIGVAFNAQYFLAKTEAINFERHVEEDNWAAAAEWADSLGIDIVSTSLGYSQFDKGEGDYTPADMDGETTIITKAASILTDRGVIVLSSAGNEARTPWHIITAPADGKKVIAVGAVNINNALASFSSRGPTADGRIKPDVVGIGVSVLSARSDNQSYWNLSGTSLSCPIIAGICALVLEEFPNLTVSNMIQIIRNAGDNPTPNNERGWGKVDAVRAFAIASGEETEANDFFVQLLDNNPFGSYTTFGVGLPQASPITITIYNILGQKIKTLLYSGISGSAMLNRKQWDRRNENGMPVASGIYPFRVHTNFGNIDSKVVIIR